MGSETRQIGGRECGNQESSLQHAPLKGCESECECEWAMEAGGSQMDSLVGKRETRGQMARRAVADNGAGDKGQRRPDSGVSPTSTHH